MLLRKTLVPVFSRCQRLCKAPWLRQTPNRVNPCCITMNLDFYPEDVSPKAQVDHTMMYCLPTSLAAQRPMTLCSCSSLLKWGQPTQNKWLWV